MDEDPNQLIEAPEDDDINDLNDVTFGSYVENCKQSFYVYYMLSQWLNVTLAHSM